jgi:DNA polymerase
MAKALAAALPGKLELAAKALKLTPKDSDGHRLMLRLSKPGRNGEFPDLTPDLLDRLGAYCVQDVATERELDERLPDLSKREQKVWHLDQVINQRGIGIDRETLEACERLIRRELEELNTKLSYITDHEVTSTTQVARLKGWCARRGVVLTSLEKPALDKAISELDENSTIRKALEIRAAAAHSSARKVTALLNMAGRGDRVRGSFKYCGAATGRWSAGGCQLQNLKRLNGLDEGKAIAALRAESLSAIQGAFGPPLELIGSAIRLMIMAPAGRKLIGCDLTSIEPRVLSWLAADTANLDVYRDYDAGVGPDPYVSEYAGAFHVDPWMVTDNQRGIGKIMVLALGYSGGSGALMSTARKIGQELDEDEANELKTKYRANHPMIVNFWDALNEKAIAATWEPNKVFSLGAHLAFKRVGDFLYLRLPSSRKLAYPFPKLIKDSLFDGYSVSFKDTAGGQFRDCRNGRGSYGGLFCENAVQATARDLLVEAMVRLERAGYSIVLHCHDEAVAEVDEAFGSPGHFKEIMCMSPIWAPDLPIAAKAWEGARYAK